MNNQNQNIFLFKRHAGLRSQDGFTLIEVLVALSLLAVGLATTIELFSGSLSQAYYSRVYTTATFLANQKMGEVLLSKESPSLTGSFDPPYENFDYNVEISSKNLPVGNIEDSFFSDETVPPSPSLQKVRVTVSWEQDHREKKLYLETLQAMVIKQEIEQ